METIRIYRKLDSATLPELEPLIGKTVQITVDEAAPVAWNPRERIASKEEWDAAVRAIDDLEGYDFDAVQRQRDYDLLHAKDHQT